MKNAQIMIGSVALLAVYLSNVGFLKKTVYVSAMELLHRLKYNNLIYFSPYVTHNALQVLYDTGVKGLLIKINGKTFLFYVIC